MADDEWTPEELELERAMLTLAPGTYVELHGAVVFCSKDGIRGAMNADDWKAMRETKGMTAKRE